MADADQLGTYRRKRDFAKTPEPAGEAAAFGPEPIFVVQKHRASHLHYDFRLEIEGVLASWAVPKSPSTNPADKRLAMRVEDHPLDYASFEGTIPEGEYGAGVVIVWDAGFYRNVTEHKGKPRSMTEGLEEGYLRLELLGKKLRGVYSLARFGRDAQERRWLLAKSRDEYADDSRDITAEEPQSVLSGKTIEEM